MELKRYNASYESGRNDRIAYPMGGLGAGMMCLTGTGGLSHVSLRNEPNLTHEPLAFSAVCIKGDEGNVARVLEGRVPSWKIYGPQSGAGTGLWGKHYGLPRFAASRFTATWNCLELRMSVLSMRPSTRLPRAALGLPIVRGSRGREVGVQPSQGSPSGGTSGAGLGFRFGAPFSITSAIHGPKVRTFFAAAFATSSSSPARVRNVALSKAGTGRPSEASNSSRVSVMRFASDTFRPDRTGRVPCGRLGV